MKWSRALVPCLAVLTVAGILLAGAPAQADPILRVGVYNIHYGEGEDGTYSPSRIANVIRPSVTDIVGLNEVYHNNPFYGGHHTDAQIAGHLGSEWTSIHGRNFSVFGFVHYGNSILTRLPVLSSENTLLSKTPDFEQRGVLRVTVEWNGGPLHVFCTHLGLNSPERLRHVDEILALAEELEDGPVLIIGDFNEQPSGSVVRNFKQAGFTDNYRRHGVEPGHTFGNPDPFWRIDYIMADPRFKAVATYVPDDPLVEVASDHRPVFAELLWTGDGEVKEASPDDAGVLFDSEDMLGFSEQLEANIQTPPGQDGQPASRLRYMGGRYHWQVMSSASFESTLSLPPLASDGKHLVFDMDARIFRTSPQGFRFALGSGGGPLGDESAVLSLSRSGAGSWLASGSVGEEETDPINLTNMGTDPLAPQQYRFHMEHIEESSEFEITGLIGPVEVLRERLPDGGTTLSDVQDYHVRIEALGTGQWPAEVLVSRVRVRGGSSDDGWEVPPSAPRNAFPILYPNQHLGVHHDPAKSAFQSVRSAVSAATTLSAGYDTPVHIRLLSDGPFTESAITIPDCLFDNDFALTADSLRRPVLLSQATGWSAIVLQRQGRSVIEDMVILPARGTGQTAFRVLDVQDPDSPLGYDILLRNLLISSNDGADGPVASLDGLEDPGLDPANPGPVRSFRGNAVKVRSTEIGEGRIYRLHMRDVVVSGMIAGETTTGGYGIRGFMNGAPGSEWVIGEGCVVSYNVNITGGERAAIQPGGNEGAPVIFRIEGSEERPVRIINNENMNGIQVTTTSTEDSEKSFSWVMVANNSGRGLTSNDSQESYTFQNVTFANNGGEAVHLPAGHSGTHRALGSIFAGNGNPADTANTLAVGTNSSDGSFLFERSAIVLSGPFQFNEELQEGMPAGAELLDVLVADPQFLSVDPSDVDFLNVTNPEYYLAGPGGDPLRGAAGYSGPVHRGMDGWEIN